MLAATEDTVYQWRISASKEAVTAGLDRADHTFKFTSHYITSLATINGINLVGTRSGFLIVYSHLPSVHGFKEYKISQHPISCISLYRRRDITVTICFNQKDFIQGELIGREFLNIRTIRRTFFVQTARYIIQNRTSNLLSIGYNDQRRLYIHDDNTKKTRPLVKDSVDLSGGSILDCSKEGYILFDDADGLIYLQDILSKKIRKHIIGNSLENNDGGHGCLVPYDSGLSIFYAGTKYPELAIANYMQQNIVRVFLKQVFLWQGESEQGWSEQGFISSISCYRNQVVLGLRHSVIIFQQGVYEGLEDALAIQDSIEEASDPDGSSLSTSESEPKSSSSTSESESENFSTRH